jgi:hypothetical protein
MEKYNSSEFDEFSENDEELDGLDSDLELDDEDLSESELDGEEEEEEV